MPKLEEMNCWEREEYMETVFNIIDVLDYLRDRGNLHFKDKREYNERLERCIEIFVPRDKIPCKFIVDVEKYFS